jgi:hypothetical protein
MDPGKRIIGNDRSRFHCIQPWKLPDSRQTHELGTEVIPVTELNDHVKHNCILNYRQNNTQKQISLVEEAYVVHSRHKDIYREQCNVDANVAQSLRNSVT